MICLFGRGGRREEESHIYICTGGRSPVGGGFFPRSLLFRSDGVVGSGKVLRGNRATFQKKI